MDDITNESSPQKPTVLQRIWHVTKLVLPHSINIFCIYALYWGGIEAMALYNNPTDRIENVINTIVGMLFFVVMLLLGMFLPNKWARRVFRYLSVPLFWVFIWIYDMM